LRIQRASLCIQYIHGLIGKYIENAAGMTFRSVGQYSRPRLYGIENTSLKGDQMST
jgi:hypothetical protein